MFPSRLFLCCLLGSASLVYGQALIRLAASNEASPADHTREIISFSDVGSGASGLPRPWYCYTEDTGSVLWLFPNGSELPIYQSRGVAVQDEVFIRYIPTSNFGVALYRGPMHFSPDGEHCCVRNNTALRRCVTFTPCPTLSPLSNGRISYNATTNMVTYTCDTGYNISGATPITCMSDGTSNGTWSPSPPTVTCALVDCGSPPPPGNNASLGILTRTTYQGTVTYTCDGGYEVSNGVTTAMATCMASGMWEPLPTCQPVNCTLPPPGNNASPGQPSSTVYQGSVTYTCNTGYWISTAVTTATATCMANRMWEPVLACTAVDCNDIPAPSNGTVNTSSGTTFMMNATYTCNTGYNIVGEDTQTCEANRMWTPEAPTCAPVDCGPLTVPNGQVNTTSGTTFMNTATYTCDDGYNLNRVSDRTCQANGTWSLTAPTCDPVDCGSLNNTANGSVDTSSGTTFMMTATYTCNPGYNIVGNESRTCGASGTSGVWPGEAPVCNLIPLSSGPMNVIANNSVLSLAAIGSSALTCHTELTTCCRRVDNNGNALGEWRGPNGDSIPDSNTNGFYVSRGISSISLNLAEGSSEVAGTYCCQVPRESGATTTHCVMVTVSASLSIAAVAGGIAGAIVVVILVILLIIFLVLFLRRSRKKQYEPAVKNSGLSTVYSDASDEGVATISKDHEPTITGFSSESRANEGEEVVIKPKVGGHPPPSLTWYHDGKKVTADYAKELDQDGGLSFPCVETKHAGVYKLVASGPSGTAEKELQLIVVPEGDEEEEVTDKVDLTPIPVDGFGAYVTEQHANGNKKFASNYLGLGGKEGEHSTAIAKQHKEENRFGNILVYDDNLIILDPIPGQEDCQSDYINACYVDGFVKRNKFIASQGPLPNTVVDFWRMMWQERPPIIVMLTNVMENNKTKCQQYWPDSGSVSYGPFTVTITDQQVLADYTVRNLLLAIKGESGKPFKTTQFHFTTWPDHGVPDYATPILGFHRRVKSQHKPSRGPLLVHCSAGVGRTGTYIAIDNVLDQIATEGIVDISGTIVKSRNQRMKMVQTRDQYVFIHDAILESVTCGDTQISAADLHRQIQKMSSVAPGKTITEFQYQFQILEQVSPNPNEVNCSSALRHKNLNRGIQYLPIENHRVFLKGQEPGRDYINAVFVNGYKHQKAYIIAQNPLDSTVRNFWKMIYDRKCAAVVMLTPLSENGKEACSQYWPECGNVTSFGEFTIDNLGEEVNTGFVMRQLSVLNKKTKKTLQIIQIQILDWKSTGACANFKIITDVNEEVVKVQRRTGNKAIVVHCSDTATRSGMYCSVATTIDRCKTEGVVDVFQVVKALRVHKPGAVPSVDNYKDVFEALLVYLDSFDTYANFL
ncbi:receptor-type tyrosine-protein phosphatase kappa-like [Halichondria panicea]|uniref:receptor-type tyrosine-protein phosphatase kappa-like n=1 Tax=Halichondria panicea TaxID=6063 RepID=UPI00312B8BD5